MKLSLPATMQTIKHESEASKNIFLRSAAYIFKDKSDGLAHMCVFRVSLVLFTALQPHDYLISIQFPAI